jgi:L-galactose dehydrogenase
MELRELGGTGLRVSAVGFGASPLGNVFGDVPRDTARAAVRRALDLGINFFDTSPYGTPHRLSIPPLVPSPLLLL